ncbi:MAG TPA: hypothetical protein VHT05_04415 [Candidatus Elarobacter sp.]|jgi:hypothetical protein|nr:hypothetical protein [Candidatus Elarobacter sp.]
MNDVLSVRRLRRFVFAASALALAACGGGGGSGASTPSAGGGGNPVTLSGDMVAYQPSRGWNYQGTVQGQAFTISIYADPQQGTVDPMIAFAVSGTVANAFAGEKLGGVGIQSTSSGYTVGSYVLLNADGSIYADGAVSGSPMLVASTLTQGQPFSTYPGATATVETIGTVPGSGACPTPATGATVQYTYAGQTYSVSYVPGCGITQYVGNHGEVFTLVSVGSYPQLGAQSTRRMNTLTMFDTVASAAHILLTHSLWRPLSK